MNIVNGDGDIDALGDPNPTNLNFLFERWGHLRVPDATPRSKQNRRIFPQCLSEYRIQEWHGHHAIVVEALKNLKFERENTVCVPNVPKISSHNCCCTFWCLASSHVAKARAVDVVS